jgi:hypothetical protein
MNQLSLFPHKETVAEAFEEIKARLPINDENELIAVLNFYINSYYWENQNDINAAN